MDEYPLTESLGKTWMLFRDPMDHGMFVVDQGGLLMSPQQLENVVDGISEFLVYHGWDKLRDVVQQQWDSIPLGAAVSPPLVERLLYPEEYAQTLTQCVEEPDLSLVPDRSGFVYVVLADTLYKIGRTIDFKGRLRALSPMLPYELETIAVIKTADMYRLEEMLHEMFASKRKKGEWFELEDEDIEYLKGLANE